MAEAKINREYLLRMSGVALFMLAICVWSLYDGFVAWPKVNAEYEQVRPMLLATNLSARAWLAKTGADESSALDAVYAAAGGRTPSKLVKKIDEYKMADNLPQEMFKKHRERERQDLKRIFQSPVYSPGDLEGQVVMAVIATLVGCCILFNLLPKLKKVFIADESALHGSGFGNTALKYADIESMDWKLWDKKGIVKVTFKDGTQFTLDGWHFNGIKDVVEVIKDKRPDLTVGATPVSPE